MRGGGAGPYSWGRLSDIMAKGVSAFGGGRLLEHGCLFKEIWYSLFQSKLSSLSCQYQNNQCLLTRWALPKRSCTAAFAAELDTGEHASYNTISTNMSRVSRLSGMSFCLATELTRSLMQCCSERKYYRFVMSNNRGAFLWMFQIRIRISDPKSIG